MKPQNDLKMNSSVLNALGLKCTCPVLVGLKYWFSEYNEVDSWNFNFDLEGLKRTDVIAC